MDYLIEQYNIIAKTYPMCPALDRLSKRLQKIVIVDIKRGKYTKKEFNRKAPPKLRIQ